MARIKKIEIENFRSIQQLSWTPSPGINCLIGPGDSGKSTLLDSIDLCLGARRNYQFCDADFYHLDISRPIKISITIGDLQDNLKNLESYGLYLRGFIEATGKIDDEPAADAETVLTLELTVNDDLEPVWSLVSNRSAAQDLTKNLNWRDRVTISPTRIGVLADYHLGWRRGSVLNYLTEEKADSSAALTKAARDARAAFGKEAQEQLGETLQIVSETAKQLGIPTGENVKALLDAQSVTFSGGTISLHNESGVPLRGLGTGSTRLLIAGLQKKAAVQSTIILVDELEYGLEPHRIIRFLDSLGSKEKSANLQVFMTTHSPVAIRELSGNQIYVIRNTNGVHRCIQVDSNDGIQSTLRLFPEAFLAKSVIVCEGASEVGLIRGLDWHRSDQGMHSINASGVALIDSGGGNPDTALSRALAFQQLGYNVSILRDDDLLPSETLENEFSLAGGITFKWRDGRTLEDELFMSLSLKGVEALLNLAIEIYGEELVNDHIKSATSNQLDLHQIQVQLIIPDDDTTAMRSALSKASQTRKSGWFKSISKMQIVGYKIISHDSFDNDPTVISIFEQIFSWAHQ